MPFSAAQFPVSPASFSCTPKSNSSVLSSELTATTAGASSIALVLSSSSVPLVIPVILYNSSVVPDDTDKFTP